MTSKVCFENFYGNVFGTLIRDIWKTNSLYNCYQECYYSYHKNLKIPFLRTMLETMQANDSFFDCEEALIFFKFQNMYQILKFTSVDDIPEDLLSFHFKKVVPMRT